MYLRPLVIPRLYKQLNCLPIMKIRELWMPTSDADILKSEQSLLSRIGVPIYSGFIGSSGHRIRTISTQSLDGSTGEGEHIVLTHGFGAGSGLWLENIDALTHHGHVHAIDWLGMGASDRPEFPSVSDVDACESFFVESLEGWRQQMGLETFTLMGHSLGGYLSACYALKYPERVTRLVLVSPVGVPEKPHGWTESVLAKSRWYRLAHCLWMKSITPQSIIRTFGPYGPRIMGRYTERRFAFKDASIREDLKNYLYHIAAAPGSSEYALSTLLEPGAWAYKPLVHRIDKLQMPTLFLYGENDWMKADAVLEVQEQLNNPPTVHHISDAGHHLYLDNPLEFNGVINQWFRQSIPLFEST